MVIIYLMGVHWSYKLCNGLVSSYKKKKNNLQSKNGETTEETNEETAEETNEETSKVIENKDKTE